MKKGFFFLVMVISFVLISVGSVFAEPVGWSEDIRISNDNAISFIPSLSNDLQGNAHISWTDNRTGNWELYYTKLDGSGNILIGEIQITSGVIGVHTRHSLKTDNSGNVHVVWHDRRDGNFEIYYTKLNNNGNTLVNDKRITFSDSESAFPSLSLDPQGNIHIVWRENYPNSEIYYTKLNNNGNTLVNDLRLTFAEEISNIPSLSVDTDGNVHVVWGDGRHGIREIYYTKLNNNGDTIVDDLRLTFNDPEPSSFPKVANDLNNNVHIIWSGTDAIHYTKLDSNGNTIVNDKSIIFGSGYSLSTDQNGNVHIAWVGSANPGNSEIYYTKLNNNGNIIISDKRLTFDSGRSFFPAISVDVYNKINLVWHDNRTGFDSLREGVDPVMNWEIFYKKTSNPVILVHGYYGDPDETWQTMKQRLEQDGFSVFETDLQPGGAEANGNIIGYANVLRNHIQQVKAQTGATEVDLIVHSMGGFV